MPDPIFIRDFTSGWCPSDDAVNGRPNACLQMDNLELDTNGAIALIGGTNVKYSGSSNPHTLYSRYVNNTRCDYAACADGSITRNGSSIGSGGDSTNAGFSTAFNFTLIASGSTRLKDLGSGTPIPLGVTGPTIAPVDIHIAPSNPFATVGNIIDGNLAAVSGTKSVVTQTNYPSGHALPASIRYLQMTADATTGIAIVQTNNSIGPLDLTSFAGLHSDTGTATDNDFIPIFGYTPNPFGCSLQIDILLVAPNAFGDQVSDYYSYKISDLSTAHFDAYSGVFTLYIKRSDFTRVGNNGSSWINTWGLRITFTGAPSQVINILGNSVNPSTSSVISMLGGSNALFGVYEFAQINVNNTGSYVALSGMSPVTNAIMFNGEQAKFQLQTPTDSQVDEIWIMARSTGAVNDLGNTSQLSSWYQLLKVLSPFGSPPIDTTYSIMGDRALLALNITYNQNLQSIAHSVTPDKIFDIIGPIEGRWLYFTTNFMYPSDINDPDLINPGLGVRTCGSTSEVFMWARQISANVVLVGTSIDIYILTGTFQTLADGSIDIYYNSIGAVKVPPIAYDAAAYNGAVYYLAKDGWRSTVATSYGSTYAGQNNSLLVAPNTDRLYRNETCYEYPPINLKIQPGTVRYPLVVSNNKLFCFITGTSRVEVYDFTRQYWRTFNYGLGDCSAATDTQDGQVIAYYSADSKLREVGVLTTKLVDGSRVQSYNLLLTYKDGGTPRQRKDLYTLKSRCFTPGGGMTVQIKDEGQFLVTLSSLLSSPFAQTETYLDLSQQFIQANHFPKSLQFNLFGSGSDFLLQDLSVDHDIHPMPVTAMRVQPSNFGNPSKKRIRTWPFIIDTRGNNVLVTPNVDGVPSPQVFFNSNRKSTEYYFFNTDVFGVDYGMDLYDPSGLMEIWEISSPVTEQALPVPRQFWQVGPQEFGRFGKVVQMGFRVFPLGSSIPFSILFADSSQLNGTFTIKPNAEDIYYTDIPKGVAGRILRVTLGPCNFNFHPYYLKFRMAQSGGQENTELQWITISSQGQGS